MKLIWIFSEILACMVYNLLTDGISSSNIIKAYTERFIAHIRGEIILRRVRTLSAISTDGYGNGYFSRISF